MTIAVFVGPDVCGPSPRRGTFEPRNLQKTRWVAAQDQIVRDATRLLKLWARRVSDAEAREDEEVKINSYALTLLLAALHGSCMGVSALELCTRLWRVISSLRVDLLAVVSFDADFCARLSRGPRFHRELVMSLSFNGNELFGLMVEDIVQPDRFYSLSDSLSIPTLAKYAASALLRLSSATWGQVIAQDTPANVLEVLDRFSSFMKVHWSFFRGRVATCPEGHSLKLGTLGTDLICDDCDMQYDGMHMQGCRKCDFDLCPWCATVVRMMRSQFPLPMSPESLFRVG